MTQQANAVVLSLLTIMLASSVLLAGVITLGNYFKTHHDDVNTARMNTFIAKGVKP